MYSVIGKYIEVLKPKETSLLTFIGIFAAVVGKERGSTLTERGSGETAKLPDHP